jgi:MFS family permease
LKFKFNFLFFIAFGFGLSVLAPAQRYPEIQKQLHLSNGIFGTFVSLITLGSIIAFIVGSRIIHVFGIGRAFFVAITGINLTLAGYPHVHSSTIFVVCNIFFGFFSTLTHISMNAQGIHIGNKTKQSVLPFMSGVWSMGALSTAVIAALITKHVSLSWHLDILSAIAFLIGVIGMYGLKSDYMRASEEYEAAPRINFKNILRTYKFFPAISIGQILLLQPEYSAGDWSAIFAHTTVGVSVSRSVLCYLSFISTMGVMRLSANKLNQKFSQEELMKWIPRIGGVGFGISIISSSLLSKNNQNIAFALALIAYIFAGFGTSFMVPTLFSIAANRSQAMPGTVIASMGLVGATFSLIIKVLISVVADVSNLTIALMIPAVMLIAGSRMSKFGSKVK